MQCTHSCAWLRNSSPLLWSFRVLRAKTQTPGTRVKRNMRVPTVYSPYLSNNRNGKNSWVRWSQITLVRDRILAHGMWTATPAFFFVFFVCYCSHLHVICNFVIFIHIGKSLARYSRYAFSRVPGLSKSWQQYRYCSPRWDLRWPASSLASPLQHTRVWWLCSGSCRNMWIWLHRIMVAVLVCMYGKPFIQLTLYL